MYILQKYSLEIQKYNHQRDQPRDGRTKSMTDSVRVSDRDTFVEMRGGVTDAGRTNDKRTLKKEVLSQWKLETEFRKWQIKGILLDLGDDG